MKEYTTKSMHLSFKKAITFVSIFVEILAKHVIGIYYPHIST